MAYSSVLTLTPRQRDENLEIASDKPNLSRMLQEIERAYNGPMVSFLRRNDTALRWWNARWPGQTADGRRHDQLDGKGVFPWEGASDTRIRTVKECIHDHTMILKAAFNGSKIQASTVRPLAPGNGRRSNHVTALLKWQTDTQMRAELQREVPLAFAWRNGYGAAVLGAEWEQSRRLEYHQLTVPILADAIAFRDHLAQPDAEQLYQQLQAAFGDPSQEEALVNLVRTLMLDTNGAPVLSAAESRRIVREIGQQRYSEVPVPAVFSSKPKWTALRIGIDIVFLDRTGDMQQEPFIARFERVSETTLRDRLVTEDYDEEFVDTVVQYRGRASERVYQANAERLAYGGEGYGYDEEAADNGVDLVHYYYKTIMRGTPCLYRTVFAPAIVRAIRSRSGDPLYAKHGKHEYEHGEYPFTPLRFEKEARRITSSQGIAEQAYTWEQEIKTQADGLADRTTLINRPPMIVPYSRVHAIKGAPIPGAVLGVTKPSEIQWMPLPGSDGTPVQQIAQVMARVESFFGIFGANVDPDKKQMRRQELADDGLGELCLVLKQTYQLDLQYMDEQEVTAIVGPLSEPWKQSAQAIRGLYVITATFNARLLDIEYAKEKLGLIGQAMAFNQGGNANMSGVFRAAMELIDPDLADQIVDTDEVATDRERKEEKQALAQILVGMEPDKPQFGNFNLRLQTIQETLAAPGLAARVMQNEQTAALLQNRVEYFQNQIQQHEQNPQIGRALSTQTFNKKAAPQMTLAG